MNHMQEIKPESTSIIPTASDSVDVKTWDQVIADGDAHEIAGTIRADIAELKHIVDDVRAKRHRANELRSQIIQHLIYVRENKKTLLKGRGFTDFLEIDVGITRGHFSEQLKAYELCMENNKPDYFNTVDIKVLVGIARIKDKKIQAELFARAPQLTREYIRNVRRSNILGKAIDPQKLTSEAADFLKKAENELSQQIGSSMYQKVFDFGAQIDKQIDKLLNTAGSTEKREALKATLQKMIEFKFSSAEKKMNG